MKPWILYTLSAVGLLFAVLGTILINTFPIIMDKIIGVKLVIRPDSPIIGDFIAAPIPIYMQFYMFNVTNPLTILAGGKPAIQQIGPFTYLKKLYKHDLNWTNDRVEYLENSKFFFVPEMSNELTEEILITSLNPVLISVASFVDELNTPLIPVIHAIFKLITHYMDLKVFITRKVGEWLFQGYEDNLLLLVYKLTGNQLYETGKFGFFNAKNDSDGGKYSIHTGSSGLDSLQVIDEFEGSKTLGFWSDPYCDMVNGTTGSQFPLPVTTHTNLSIFSKDLCRSMYLTFEKIVFHGGLELYRYNIPYQALASRPENDCYCISPDDFTCRTSLLNLSPCRDGFSVIASTPHFYMADDDILASVDGINPSKEEHDTYFDVEPNSGLTFRAMNRIQINMPLKPFTVLPDLANVRTVILPLFWLNESVKVPEANARQLHEKLTTSVIISTWVSFFLCSIGACFAIVPLTLLMRNKCKQKETYTGNYGTNITEKTKFLESRNLESFSDDDHRLSHKKHDEPEWLM